MFLVKNNLSYLYFVIILGIFLKRIAFVLGDLLCGSIVDIFQCQKMQSCQFSINAYVKAQIHRLGVVVIQLPMAVPMKHD